LSHQKEEKLGTYITLLAAVTIAIACICYPSMASQKSWPSKEVFTRKMPWPCGVSWIALAWAVLKTPVIGPWWSFLPLLVAGFFLAFILTMALKEKVQHLSIWGCIPALMLAVLAGAETASVYHQ